MISSLELAKLCGVSQGTVDRALHNRKGISEKTKEKILAIAREHGYQPHPAALELLTGKSRMVAAIIPQFNSIFFMDLLSAIKQKIAESGFKLLIAQYDSPAELLELLRDFSARRFRASIIVPPGNGLEIPDNLCLKMKIITLLSPVTGRNVQFISPDEEQTGIDAVDFLVSRGRHRILHLTYRKSEYYAIKMRSAGYLKAMKKHGLKPEITTGDRKEKLLEIIRRSRADAIFCHNDWLALTALRHLEGAGYEIPEQISVAGVDNSPTFNSLFSGLTTMDYPREWIAGEILKVLSGKKLSDFPPRMRIILRNT